MCFQPAPAGVAKYAFPTSPPAGVAESDVSAFFADFHLPTPPRGQGVDDANKGVENKTESGEEGESEKRNQSVEPIAEEVFVEKKHLNFYN